MNLKHLTDESLLIDTKRLAQNERDVITKVLHHLKEIERRKLFSDLGYPTMIIYAVKELGYSEGSADRRINASRLMKQMPEIEKKRIDGTLSLTNLSQSSCFFKQEDIQEPSKKKAVLIKLENLTSREANKTLLELAPAKPLPKESQKLITPEFTQLKINVSNDTLKLLNNAKAMMGKFSLNDEFLKKLTAHALENITHKKFKTCSTEQNPSSGYITNQNKREVYEKSQGVCESLFTAI